MPQDPRGARVTAAISFIFAAYGVALFLTGPCLTAIAATYSVTLAEAGSLLGVVALGFLPAVLAIPAISQRWGAKATLAVGLGLASGGLGLFALAPEIGSRPHFWVALASMALVGVGAAAIEALANGMVSDANPDREAFALNLVHAFFAVGAMIGPWVAGVILARGLSWQLPYAIAAGGMLVTLFVLLPLRGTARPAEEMDPFAAFRMLRTGAVTMGLFGIVLYVSTEVGLSGWVPAFLETGLGANKAAAAVAVTILWGAMTVGRFICTALSQRFPAALFVVVLCSGTALASAGVALSPSIGACYLAVGAAGLFMASIFAMVLADVGTHVRGQAPTAFSIVVVGVGGGMLLFPPAMGWVAEAAGLRVALLGPTVLMVACAAIYGIAHLARRSRPGEARAPSPAGPPSRPNGLRDP